ncbi:hypothetical protein C5167_008662 [Papaver somniferum]|uniref:NAD(P)-binding domain-containing protein n=1 Tax=Papaver somniferum TaxID=3469 RepID=A0A4Y7JY49_PAPSO|nr:hypothetical protein C5167_008662 [Papaver somniferum]
MIYCCCSNKLPSTSSTAIINFQVYSSLPIGRSHSNKAPHYLLLSSSHSLHFLPLSDKLQTLSSRCKFASLSLRSNKRSIYAETGRRGWDVGRFLKTLFEFLVGKLSNSTSNEPVKEMATSDIILVAGATGGVGRRVVDVLRKKGLPVRILVRNKEKARKMLGPDIDLVVGDITKDSTLVPEYFKGVKKVINAVSVIVGPKEGDTPDRQKYSQGIKFFEPEVIKGDSPEMVEYNGMKILINSLKKGVGHRNGKLIFGFQDSISKELAWGDLDDGVMGGVSESKFLIDHCGNENGGPTGLFKGVVSTKNNGCFTSIRTGNFSIPEDLSAYDGLELRIKGYGRRYKLIVRISPEWDTIGYTAIFDTVIDQWRSVSVHPPFYFYFLVLLNRLISQWLHGHYCF